MKRILTIITGLVLCCLIFGGCSEAALTEEEIFKKHIQAMEEFEASNISHYQNTITYEFDGELADEFVWKVWTNGLNSYSESVRTDGTTVPTTLLYDGGMYTFSSEGEGSWRLYQTVGATSKVKRYDEAAKVLACEATDTGYTVTTAADWNVGTNMGLWLCENAQINYTYDRDWTLKEVCIISQLVPDPDKAEMIQDVESGICTEVCTFYETVDTEIVEKIDGVWAEVKANAE